MMGEALSAPDRGAAHEVELRNRVSGIIGQSQLVALRKLDVRWTLQDAAVIYALLASVLAATWALHSRLGPIALLATPALAFVTGVACNWINVQIHEASHNLLLPNKARNDAYCNWVLGVLALQDVQTYRATHGMHHSQLHTADDPDRWVYATRVGSTAQLVRGLLEDLSLWTALKRGRQVSEFFAQHPRLRPTRSLSGALGKLLGQLIILGLFVGTGGAWGVAYYVSIHLYGLLGVFPALVRIRTVVQHYQPPTSSLPDPLAAFTSRSTVASFLQFLIIGARMDYHFEHHLFPNIPYYNLKQMHQVLLEAGLFDTIRSSWGQQLRTTNYFQSFRSFTVPRASDLSP